MNYEFGHFKRITNFKLRITKVLQIVIDYCKVGRKTDFES